MRTSDLPLGSLVALNNHAADAARHWRSIVKHMERLGFDRNDYGYQQAVVIREASIQLALHTHELLNHARGNYDFRKAASAGHKSRAARRDRREQGY